MFLMQTVCLRGRELLRLADMDSSTSACIDMADGMNLVQWECAGRSWIDWDAARDAAGATYGVPLLYPTPNRVRGGRFTFEGREVQANMHGCVRKRAFAPVRQKAGDSFACVTGRVEFQPGQPEFFQFPYPSSLSVTITLTQNALQWEYTVQNDGETALPYSFALHPFFKKHGATFLRTAADCVMEMDSDHYPTGRILPVADTEKDLRRFVHAESVALDDVFCTDSAPQAWAEFREAHMRLTLCASPECKHLVVYTPPGKDWFCLENQTSSTDCHNLHSAGLCEAANLQIVAPHTSKSGRITMTLEPL